jgi:hypothetical protein
MLTNTIAESCAATRPVPEAADEEQLATVLPVDPTEAAELENGPTTLHLVELLLKGPKRLDGLINHDAKKQAILIPRFLGIALASYVLYGLAMIIILNAAQTEAYPRHVLWVPPADWHNGSALGLVVAYSVGLVAATCICLPSFYFFSLLAGVRLTMLQIVGQVLRCKANSAMVLFGILPIYVAVVLGLIVFDASVLTLELWLYIGLVLPFVAGLEGVRSIYRGVMGMSESLPPERRYKRECFLRRLALSWAACYTAVCPVLIYRLWEFLATQFAQT